MTQIGQSDKKNLSFGETFFCTGNGNPDKSCSQSSGEDDVDDHNGVGDDHAYLIFVIFFTRANFLENKIYTEKTHKLRQNTQKIAIFLRYYGKIHS